MREQAQETEERGTAVASSFEGKKTAILEEAAKVKSPRRREMMKTYLDQASDTLDGFEFLTMAEAGEVGHWEILDTLNKRAGNGMSRSSLVGRYQSSGNISRPCVPRRSISPRRKSDEVAA